MCCTQHVARMQHCMLQTADSARLKKCRVMMFTSGMLRDVAEIQRIFYFYFWKKIKRLKVMRLSDVLQSTLLLRPCPISCFEDSRFASAAAFRCFSASFALRTKTPDIKYGYIFPFHPTARLQLPNSTLFNPILTTGTLYDRAARIITLYLWLVRSVVLSRKSTWNNLKCKADCQPKQNHEQIYIEMLAWFIYCNLWNSWLWS